MRKVLVVEDEASIRELIALNLQMAGWEVLEAENGERGLRRLKEEGPCDAAVLDVMLPGIDGFSLCESIRRDDQNIGIIILSAKGLEEDKIRGLSIGADDYMTKPFSVSELLARIEALCRRVNRGKNQPAAKETRLVSGKFVLDEASRILYKGETPIDLTHGAVLPQPGHGPCAGENSGGRVGAGLLRRCEERGCEHPPSAHEDRG